ncbi:MAG TPA: arginase family protein [Marisediminicola sp.]|jgi:arginase|nr:arginase [Cryobacterium sp.]HEV7957347.1 arginase family protein [Marisediminicola sp.]
MPSEPSTFIVVPQWQGSVSPRAMRLSDGAEAIRGDLPGSRTRTVEVPAEAGDAMETGINRFSSLRLVRQRMDTALHDASGIPLTIGGDCGVSLAAVENAARRHPGDLALVWFDAHPDLHDPGSSPSGGFSGMVLRAIMGDGIDGLHLQGDAVVPAARVVLAGVRDIEEPEAELITQRGIANVPVDGVESRATLTDAVRATGSAHVYLHIDLDVLDPSALTGLANPLPFGASVEALTGAITALRSEFTLAGATLAGFAPASADAADTDLPSILRILGALTK